MNQLQFFLVEESVLPEVFAKVIEAKRLLAQGKVQNYSQAAKAVELSRSAFYKYKDSVFAYQEENSIRMVTVSLLLEHQSGRLSEVLSFLGQSGMNIVTINQNIPLDGVAPVTVSMQNEKTDASFHEVLEQLKQLPGVVSVRLLSGG